MRYYISYIRSTIKQITGRKTMAESTFVVFISFYIYMRIAQTREFLPCVHSRTCRVRSCERTVEKLVASHHDANLN